MSILPDLTAALVISDKVRIVPDSTAALCHQRLCASLTDSTAALAASNGVRPLLDSSAEIVAPENVHLVPNSRACQLPVMKCVLRLMIPVSCDSSAMVASDNMRHVTG